ncbi:hypothetical protein HPB50_018659 [Hyalomma asiaticum]|uniref:Uncharacterized protein n=1 Tax=Hyalomma asiaticum TaxID=266040 RepID=A0ACB7SGL6_HYAAI|nr:hypothetical protein HPB50_018659 [Hyalomma asiaticum]
MAVKTGAFKERTFLREEVEQDDVISRPGVRASNVAGYVKVRYSPVCGRAKEATGSSCKLDLFFGLL